MYSYIIGKVTEVMSNAIVLENNGIGYLINTPNPFALKKEMTIKSIYISRLKKMNIAYLVLKLKKKKNYS